MPDNPSIVVVGSVNLDIVARATRLPVPGETVTGATLDRFPGGKGANQALAAKRLGAEVTLIACVGKDAEAEAALMLLESGGVDLSRCVRVYTAPTGIALISVSDTGENQIVVAPGANRQLRPDVVDLPAADAMICQLEVPQETLDVATASFDGFVCLNLAPAADVSVEMVRRADLIVVNEVEADFYGDVLAETPGLVARTSGSAEARLMQGADVVAIAQPPSVDAVDTTGAGDTFTAALTVALVEGQGAKDALSFACAAGAASTMVAGAQPSLPSRERVEELLSLRGA